MAQPDVKIRLTADDRTRAAFASANGNLQKLQAGAAKLNSAFGALGAAISVGALASFAKSGIDAADSLNDMSQRLGVSVKDLASFKLAAEQSGTSLDGIGNGIARLTRSIGEAEAGNTKLAAALSSLGVTARDPKEAFFQLADAVQRIQDPAQRAALLSQVLGKSYQELVPLLNQGGQALRESARQSETFADAMARLAPEADAFNDNLALLKNNAAGFASELLSKVVPAINQFAERMSTIRAAIGAGGLFASLNLTGTVKSDLNTVQGEIAQIESTIARLRKNSGGLDSSIAPLTNQLANLQKVRAELIAIAVAAGQQPPKSAANKKQEGIPRPDSINLNTGFQHALKKAFATTPVDNFLDKFKTARKEIASEYAKLRAEFDGGAAGGPVSALDLSAQLTQGRAALSGGDAEAANAAVARGKTILSSLAGQESTTGFEKSYFLRALETLQTDIVAASEANAIKARDAINEQIEKLGQEAPRLAVQIDEKLVLEQVRAVIEQAQKSLQDNPLRLAVVPEVSTSGLQSVDLSRTALQYGRRR